MTRYLLPTSTTTEERDRDTDVALLPIGSFEQHGTFLPLATDTVIACTIAAEIASTHGARLLPPVTVSCSHEHAAWAGTVSISAATLQAVVWDIADSLRRSGIPWLVLVNGHGGNYVLANVVQEASVHGRHMALFPGSRDWSVSETAAGIHTRRYSDMHAGERETSILLHAHPELVRPGYEEADEVTDERTHMLSLGLAPYTGSGVVGRPSLASAAKGRALVASLVDSFAEYLTMFRAEIT